jgi:cell division transport system ATP-binding protein
LSTITFSQVSYASSTGEEVLSKCDLQIEKGSLTVLLGPSGSGKSTLLKLLTRELQPTYGEITTPYSGNDLVSFRRTLGVVSSESVLHDDRTVEENIELLLELAGTGSSRREERVGAILERFGLAGIAQKYPRSLSMGERQRALIARAAASEPFVLLADEPAAHLDSAASSEIVRLLQHENLRGMTVIVATSDPGFAGQFSNATIVPLARS